MISSDEFTNTMDALGVRWSGVHAVAVAVSGGPDSMALCFLLNQWSVNHNGPDIQALIVDHGLREGSAQEAASVKQALERFEKVEAHILEWAEKNPEAKIQEEARRARYGLMAGWCAEHKIEYLFLGHHMDDQAETFLFRLAKGSGLDGLSAMRARQSYDEGLTLARPLLAYSKRELLETCRFEEVFYVEDPSNHDEAFARVRLRESAKILEKEGLSAKRLANTAKRMNRARLALDEIADKVYKTAIFDKNTKRIVFNIRNLILEPDEIALRCVLKGIADLQPGQDYVPRMEKIETLLNDLISAMKQGGDFRKRTLGGVIFECDADTNEFVMSAEK